MEPRQIVAIEQALAAKLPALAGVIVMAGVRFEAVYRPDPPDEDAP